VRQQQSAARRAERWPWIWAAIVTVLAIAVISLVVGIVLSSRATTQANEAASRAQATADCVNRVLAERDRITGQLHEADVTRVQHQEAAEKVKTAGLDGLAHAKTQQQGLAAFALYMRGEAQFAQTLADYVARSNELRAAQKRHPLGVC
jgi:hypothetical protein